MDYHKISIIIQARSTSSRFPGKIFEKIGAKQILQHVLDACHNASGYINMYTQKHGIICNVALAVPYKDELIGHYSKNTIVEGPEQDVLRRYVLAADHLQADHIVRITADCPFVPPYIISRAIKLAVTEELDFLTNADPRFRTAPDGHDVEVMSRKMLTYLDENAKLDLDREHVTTYLHGSLPNWAKKADIVGFADLRDVKLSVDTREDLERLIAMHKRIFECVRNSPKAHRL